MNTEQCCLVNTSQPYSQKSLSVWVLKCCCQCLDCACIITIWNGKLPSIPFICLFILLFSYLTTHSICVLVINFGRSHSQLKKLRDINSCMQQYNALKSTDCCYSCSLELVPNVSALSTVKLARMILIAAFGKPNTLMNVSFRLCSVQ